MPYTRLDRYHHTRGGIFTVTDSMLYHHFDGKPLKHMSSREYEGRFSKVVTDGFSNYQFCITHAIPEYEPAEKDYTTNELAGVTIYPVSKLSFDSFMRHLNMGQVAVLTVKHQMKTMPSKYQIHPWDTIEVDTLTLDFAEDAKNIRDENGFFWSALGKPIKPTTNDKLSSALRKHFARGLYPWKKAEDKNIMVVYVDEKRPGNTFFDLRTVNSEVILDAFFGIGNLRLAEVADGAFALRDHYPAKTGCGNSTYALDRLEEEIEDYYKLLPPVHSLYEPDEQPEQGINVMLERGKFSR